jgi:hypothetical protein
MQQSLSTLQPSYTSLLKHSTLFSLPPCFVPSALITMPIRNPFRRAGVPEHVDEAQRSAPENGFRSTAVSGATPLQIKDPTEYKLSGETPMPTTRGLHRVNRRLRWSRDQ